MLTFLIVCLVIGILLAIFLAIVFLPPLLWSQHWAKNEAKKIVLRGEVTDSKKFDQVSSTLATMTHDLEAVDLFSRLQQIKWTPIVSNPAVASNQPTAKKQQLIKGENRTEIDAKNRQALEQHTQAYHEGIIKGIEILATPESCSACKTAAAWGIYSPDNVPQLPIKNCTHPKGCRCCYIPGLRD